MSVIYNHNSCSDDHRDEYCIVTASDPEGSVSVVADMIDDLLYGGHEMPDTNFHWRNGVAERTLKTLEIDTSLWMCPFVEKTLYIRHDVAPINRSDSYMARIGWRVMQMGVSDDEFVTEYSIDRYTAGRTQACVEQPDLYTDERVTSPMCEYDYSQLFTELCAFDNLQKAAAIDNATVRAIEAA